MYKFVHLNSKADESEVGTFTVHTYTVNKDNQDHTVEIVDESDDIYVSVRGVGGSTYVLDDEEILQAAEQFVEDNWDAIRSMKLDKNIAY